MTMANKSSNEYVKGAEKKLKDKLIKSRIKFSDAFKSYSFCEFQEFGELD